MPMKALGTFAEPFGVPQSVGRSSVQPCGIDKVLETGAMERHRRLRNSGPWHADDSHQLQRLANGPFEFWFSNTPGACFSVLTSTTAPGPLALVRTVSDWPRTPYAPDTCHSPTTPQRKHLPKSECHRLRPGKDFRRRARWQLPVLAAELPDWLCRCLHFR